MELARPQVDSYDFGDGWVYYWLATKPAPDPTHVESWVEVVW